MESMQQNSEINKDTDADDEGENDSKKVNNIIEVPIAAEIPSTLDKIHCFFEANSDAERLRQLRTFCENYVNSNVLIFFENFEKLNSCSDK